MLMAMMADCADESLMCCRLFDRSVYDKSAVRDELTGFLQRVTWLFEEGGAMTTGYTAYMVQTLSSKRTIVTHGRPRFIGGPGCLSPGNVKQCFDDRMQNWLQLCRHTVRAELPDFAACWESMSGGRVVARGLINGSALNKKVGA